MHARSPGFGRADLEFVRTGIEKAISMLDEAGLDDTALELRRKMIELHSAIERLIWNSQYPSGN